jgi:hypothetical protein
VTRNVEAAPTIDEIVILSSPRSGTNYFCDSIGDFNEVMGFAEIFNPAAVYGANGHDVFEYISNRLGASITDPSDRRLTTFFRTEPLEALRVLGDAARLAGAKFISYKIFPRQLERADLSLLLASPGRTILFIVRRRLDAYISYEKARQTAAWKNVSTADTQPTIDAHQFMKWARATDEWFDDCVRLAEGHGKSFKIARYSEDVDVPKLRLMWNIQHNLGELGVNVTMPVARVRTRFRRQDRAVDPFRKIANGEELRVELQSTSQYDYALGHPLADQVSAHKFVDVGRGGITTKWPLNIVWPRYVPPTRSIVGTWYRRMISTFHRTTGPG